MNRRAQEPAARPAWLTEAATSMLAWEHGEPATSPWEHWLHSIDGEPLSELGQERSYPSRVTEQTVTMHRAVPSFLTARELLDRSGAPTGARALAVLSRGFVAMLGRPALPVFFPAGESFPEPPSYYPAAPSELVPVLAVSITDGQAPAFMVRPLDASKAAAAGLLPEGLPPAPSPGAVPCIELTEAFGAWAVADSQNAPGPWLRFAMSGRSGIAPEEVPAPPTLPLASAWLARVERAARALAGPQTLSESNIASLERALAGEPPVESLDVALASVEEYGRLDTWAKLRADQPGPRRAGALLDADSARYLSDEALFAMQVLILTDAPPVALTGLLTHSPALMPRVRAAMLPYPGLLRWLEDSLTRMRRKYR